MKKFTDLKWIGWDGEVWGDLREMGGWDGVGLRAWAWEMVSFRWDGESELESFREVRACERWELERNFRWELESDTERENSEMRIKEMKKNKQSSIILIQGWINFFCFF